MLDGLQVVHARSESAAAYETWNFIKIQNETRLLGRTRNPIGKLPNLRMGIFHGFVNQTIIRYEKYILIRSKIELKNREIFWNIPSSKESNVHLESNDRG